MSIIATNVSSFEEIVSRHIKNVKEFGLKDLSNWLERLDASLYSDRPKHLKIIKIQRRTILTSIGLLSFKRRYYYDEINNQYLYLLDSFLKIPKRIKILDEVKYQVIEAACEMSYEKAGRYGSDKNYPISKSTVCRAIKNLKFDIDDNLYVKNNDAIVHLQIDEKFLHILGSKNKKKLYTATIFQGKKEIGRKGKMMLLNRRILSSNKLNKLFSKINYYLDKQYKLTVDDEIYVSGDLATYIQKSPEKIFACKAIYVPDKFHIKSPILKELAIKVKDHELNNKKYMDDLTSLIEQDDKLNTNDSLMKIVRLYKKNNEAFKPYQSTNYLGCSQECMNSHYFSPRFDKVGNKFKDKTITILTAILESKLNNENIRISLKEKEYYDEVNYLLGGSKYEREKYDIDKTEMSYQTRKMFMKIEYGGN